MKTILYITFSLFVLLFWACGAVPTTRYEKEKSNQISSTTETKKEDNIQLNQKNKINVLVEDYDISRYSPELNIKKEKDKSELNSEKEIWYSFPENSDKQNLTSPQKITGTSDGYRVLVFSSDELEEIETVKLKVEENKGMHQVYSVFEPPFYKIYIGDFTELEDANSLRRKLTQLGFKEAKVIRTTINIFK